MTITIRTIEKKGIEILWNTKRILFDVENPLKKADIILQSGLFETNNSNLKKNGTIISPSLSEEERTLCLPHNKTIEIQSFIIKAIPAYRIQKVFDLSKTSTNGYSITNSETKESVYLAGPTDVIPEMNIIECDYAILPTGGECMDLFESLAATNVIHAKVFIPHSYDEDKTERELSCERFTKKCIYESKNV